MSEGDSSRDSRAGERRRLLLGVAFSLGFALLFLRRLDAGSLVEELRHVQWRWLLLSQVTKGIGLGFIALRSRIVLAPLATYRAGRPLRAHLLGLTGNNLLPFRAGELMRLDDLARAGGAGRASVLAVLVFERLMDMLAILVLAVLTIPLAFAELTLSTSAAIGGVGASLAVVLLVVVARRPEPFRRLLDAIGRRVGGRLGNALRLQGAAFLDGFTSLRSWAALGGTLLCTAGYWGCAWLGVGLWFWSFELTVPWYAPGVFVVVVALGAAVPSVPAQLGTFHLLAAYVVGLFGVSEARAANFALVGHAAAMVPFTLLGLPLLVLYAREFRWRHEVARPSDPERADAPAPTTAPG